MAPPSENPGTDPGLDLTSGDGDPGLTPDQGPSHTPQGGSITTSNMLGYYDISFNNATGEFEAIPIRGAQIALNVTDLLQPPQGDITNLQIKIIDASKLLSDGLVTVEFQITHPFNIPGLTCFDTFGILIGHGGYLFNEDPDVTYGGPNDIQLLNFDGYTRWMNPVEFTDPGLFGYTEGIYGKKGEAWTASVNPYKYFSYYLGPQSELNEYLGTSSVKDSRGAWLPGSQASREYIIQFPMPDGNLDLRFQYLILTRWAPAKDGNGNPIPNPHPKQYPPDANAPEAIYIIADSLGSTLFFNVDSGDSGGDLILNLTIYDWQGMEVLGGTGVFNEINSIGLGSPDGLFTVTGINLDAMALAGTEVSAGHNSTTLQILVEDLHPLFTGQNEIFLAVYSEDPTTYGPLGTYPQDGRLAGYTKLYVNVSPGDPTNEPPKIDEIQGETLVSCNDGETIYTCVASDPNAGDTISYKWELVEKGTIPELTGPYSEDNTATIDWADGDLYVPGFYELWFRITDGVDEVDGKLEIEKQPGLFELSPIFAEDEFTNNVYCTTTEAIYEITVESCEPDTEPSFRWKRGYGDLPDELDPFGIGWSQKSPDNYITYSWHNTDIGTWWIAAQVIGNNPQPQVSDFYLVERVNTPSEPVNPPDGPDLVNCNSTEALYDLTGGDDCDGGFGPLSRSWAMTDTSEEPTSGWQLTVDPYFIIDWSEYPSGTFYLWQMVEIDDSENVSAPLEVIRANTPPEEPLPPFGPMAVDCSMNNAEYIAGEVFDCENDVLTRQWALSLNPEIPPETGWVDFTGDMFYIDFSTVVSGDYALFQRVSDDDVIFINSLPTMVTKTNIPPLQPDVPIGPEVVTCTDPIQEYDAGPSSECDVEDIITRSWGVSEEQIGFPEQWVEFTGDTFEVDWTSYPTGMLYLYQKIESGDDERTSFAFPIVKENAAPVVGLPSGPTSVDCTMIDAEYELSELSDCDSTEFMFFWYLSSDPEIQIDGMWIPYLESPFMIDFSIIPNGDWYLFIRVFDGEIEVISDSLHIFKNNSAPDKPSIPEGLAEVTCEDLPANYDGGMNNDCDAGDHLISHSYLSTDPLSQVGGEWTAIIGGMIIVDFTTVVPEQSYYLFQKVSDGELETISDPLEIVYHNTAPEDLFIPVGNSTVSCSNDNEQYNGGPVFDCDFWQILSRDYAISTINWPPAVGWIGFSDELWTVNWSEFEEGTYYMFQRAFDGYDYTYSDSLEITVGPPALVTPDTPIGNTDFDCDGPPETYDAGDYMAGCPDVIIIREWAINTVPTPPLIGWIEFSGTSFIASPATLGIGYLYLYQRATLDMQVEYSDPLLIQVHPGPLGIPPTPIGAMVVDCESINEPYEMGEVPVACPDTPLTRSWQIQDSNFDPVTGWILFETSPIYINWTLYTTGDDYYLVQKADDTEHVQFSIPLLVQFINTEPGFLNPVSGPQTVDCTDTAAIYNAGPGVDCDKDQTLILEWGWNTIDAYPISGWEEVTGLTFIIDYSAPEIQPGDIYLFQRVSDGITTVYDPASLHVTYNNTAPNPPSHLTGDTEIDCTNVLSTYDAGFAYDCDGTELIREWAVNDVADAPTEGWAAFTGNTFDVLWSDYGFGSWFLFHRISDGEFTLTSTPLPVTYINTGPVVLSVVADEGSGPFYTDGITSGYEGLNFIDILHYTFTVEDCDDDAIESRWAVTTSPTAPELGDPAWSDPIIGNTFEIDYTAYVSEAPAPLFVFLGCTDGSELTIAIPHDPVGMWERIWFTGFSDPDDMWTEDDCYEGVGSYTWSHDDANDYLRLTEFGHASSSSVWSDQVTMPVAPGLGYLGILQAYINPAVPSGLDNVSFRFLDTFDCAEVELPPITGNGCDSDEPELKQYDIQNTSDIWDGDWKIGLKQEGFDGCESSELYVDWVGFWNKPF